MVTVKFQLRGVIQEKLVFTYTILNVDIKHLIALPCLELSNDEICLFNFNVCMIILTHSCTILHFLFYPLDIMECI